MEGWTIPSGALFHLSHLGPEFRVLCFLTSGPNRVWGFMGPPCLTYLASYILVVARADYICNVCVLVGSPVVSKPNQGQEDIVSWLAHLVRLRARSHKRTNRLPEPATDGRDRFESVASFWVGCRLTGGHPECALLVRRTLTFRSFRRLPSQVETGRTCDVYNGQLVHPCRVNLFEKPCPRLWTTLSLRPIHRITSTLIM